MEYAGSQDWGKVCTNLTLEGLRQWQSCLYNWQGLCFLKTKNKQLLRILKQLDLKPNMSPLDFKSKKPGLTSGSFVPRPPPQDSMADVTL